MTDESLHRTNYLRWMHEIVPMQVGNIEKFNGQLPEDKSIISELLPDDFARDAYAIATIYLGASANAMHSMHLMKEKSDDAVSYCITSNGTPMLARQAMECAALAKWVVESTELSDLRKRGLAQLWDDAGKEDQFFEDLKQENLIGQIGVRKAELIKLAEPLGLTKLNKNDEKVPILGLEDVSSVCAKIEIDSSLVTKEVLETAPGMANGSWIYRKTSGLAHGKSWATKTVPSTPIPEADSREEIAQSVDNVLRQTRTIPDYLIVNMALFVAFQLQNETMKNLGHLKRPQ